MRWRLAAAVPAACAALAAQTALTFRQTAPSTSVAPSLEQQARITESVRRNALHYTHELPDFICTQVTRRYVDPSGREKWQPAGTITARLSYFGQREHYDVIRVNNHPTEQPFTSIEGATSTGEFGSMLRGIFEPHSWTSFEWSRRAVVRDRPVHVFSYRVPQPFSQWRISLHYRGSNVQVVVAYRGEIFVDRNANLVLRVTLEAGDIPPGFPVQQARTMLDYDFTDIGGREFLLPLRAETRMRAGRLLTRNVTEFRGYRKFSADASIRFDSEPAPAPLPGSRTAEPPPK